MPTVVYESLVLHTPVLTTEVAGVKEQLEDKYGIIVGNDADDLRKGIETIINNPSMLDKYRKNLEHYTYDNEEIMNQIYSLFDLNVK